MVLSGMDIPLYAIRGQIASGIDIMIHLARLRNKRRVVSEISEIEGLKDGEVKLNPLYRFEEGVLKPVGTLLNADKLEAMENGL